MPRELHQWTDEMVEDLLGWRFDDHMSTAEIQSALLRKYKVRLSRCSVLGKLHRTLNRLAKEQD